MQVKQNCHEMLRLVIMAIAGQPVMLPLTSSVYVNGTLATKEAVLVDIGTGYYIEVSLT